MEDCGHNVNISKEKKNGKKKRDMLRWTELMDEALIDALIYQQRIENRVDGTFTPKALNEVAKELREKIAIEQLDKDKVKNRIKSLKSNFNECYDLFKHTSGFAWSPITKKFDAEPEVWDALIKGKPSAKKWMNTEICYYDKLLVLYAKDRATGDAAETAKEKSRRWAHKRSNMDVVDSDINTNTTENVDPLLFSNGIFWENADNANGNGNGSQATKAAEINSEDISEPGSVTSPKTKKRKSVVAKEISGIKEAIDNVAIVLKEGNDIAEKRNEIVQRTRQLVYSETEVYEELGKLGLDVHLRYSAYDFLTEQVTRVRNFFGCPAKERKDYLLHMMKQCASFQMDLD